MEPKDWIAVAALVIALASLIVAIVALKRTTGHNATMRQYASAAPDIAEEQSMFEKQWAEESIDGLQAMRREIERRLQAAKEAEAAQRAEEAKQAEAVRQAVAQNKGQ